MATQRPTTRSRQIRQASAAETASAVAAQADPAPHQHGERRGRGRPGHRRRHTTTQDHRLELGVGPLRSGRGSAVDLVQKRGGRRRGSATRVSPRTARTPAPSPPRPARRPRSPTPAAGSAGDGARTATGTTRGAAAARSAAGGRAADPGRSVRWAATGSGGSAGGPRVTPSNQSRPGWNHSITTAAATIAGNTLRRLPTNREAGEEQRHRQHEQRQPGAGLDRCRTYQPRTAEAAPITAATVSRPAAPSARPGR